MPQETYWYIDKRVIGCRFSGEVTEADLISSSEAVNALVNVGTPPLFIFVDNSAATQFPLDFKRMLQNFSQSRTTSNEIAWTVVISDNRLINFFGALVSKAFGIPTKLVKTQDEVDAFIARFAPDLADALAARQQTSQP
jgi:hypothetical protein